MPQVHSTDTAELTLRRMQADDLAACLLLTQAAGWSHGLHDWQFHYPLGRGWVACDTQERVLGTAMWWPYGNEFATLGLVVVDRSLQGRGIGRQLMTVIMNDAGPRTLQLVATQAGLKLYQQCGFQVRGGIEQHQGLVLPGIAVATPSGAHLRALTHADLAGICALDAQASGVRRDAVINAIFNLGSGVLAERNGQVLGFAMVRPAGRGSTIGPVIAGNESLAKVLIARCLDTPSGIMRVDIPAHATELSRWLATRGLECVDRVTLMQRGELHATPPAQAAPVQLFGLVSQALG